MIIRKYFKSSIFYIVTFTVLFFLFNYYQVYKSAVIQEKEAVEYQRPIGNVSKVHVSVQYRNQSCTVDGGKPIVCVKDDNDVFFPFNFLKKQFDVTGRFTKDSIFEWSTSYAKMRVPEGKYNPTGAFGHFSTYNVENRDRVKCINGETGVPMSTQWDPIPYYYPIQIAQYGLQHYSRIKTANVSTQTVSVGTESKEWKGSPGEADSSERVFFMDPDLGPVVNITSPGTVSSPGCYVYLNEDPSLHMIHFEWLPYANSSFTVLVKVLETNTVLLLHYIESDDARCIWPEITNKIEEQLSFNIALGKLESNWRNITRDILIDAGRALSSLHGQKKKKDENVILHSNDVKLVTIGFRGHCAVRQHIEQKSFASEDFFLRSAQWFVGNQDAKGGWPVPVERSIADRKLVLLPGWHSAMAQGHALSLLSRAYVFTGETKYLESAGKAVALFETSAAEGGILNKFFNNSWYEEYPTTPGSFVLNGFMYSLIGLYDFSSLSVNDASVNSTISEDIKKAGELYQTGLQSLRNLLPLFDTGSGSIYDLRHVGLQTAPNLARWDYHAVHVYLLKWLVQITGDNNLDSVANRWIGYSLGKRAKHN